MSRILLNIVMTKASESQKKIDKVASNMDKYIDKALGKEAQLLRRIIVVGIRKQAPGGKPFKPLAPSTIAAKGSTKALINHGDLIRSINVKKISSGIYFVGTHKMTKSKAGKSIVNIAEVMEFGTKDKRIPARPYLIPSFDEWKKGSQKRVLDSIVKQSGLDKKITSFTGKVL